MESNEINVYCDESCHLQNEECQTMVISCIRCPKDKIKQVTNDIITLKKRYGIWKYAEIKWNKVSDKKEAFYIDLLDYFFNNPYLKFRAYVIPDKKKLNHPAYKQDHNTFYYKIIYNLVDYFLEYDKSYNIYADKKEDSYKAKAQMKITKKFLQAHCAQKIKLQNITSYKSQVMQLNDFLQGLVCYYNRGLHLRADSSKAKINLINEILSKSIKLDKTNYDNKFNLIIWESRYNV